MYGRELYDVCIIKRCDVCAIETILDRHPEVSVVRIVEDDAFWICGAGADEGDYFLANSQRMIGGDF